MAFDVNSVGNYQFNAAIEEKKRQLSKQFIKRFQIIPFANLTIEILTSYSKFIKFRKIFFSWFPFSAKFYLFVFERIPSAFNSCGFILWNGGMNYFDSVFH